MEYDVWIYESDGATLITVKKVYENQLRETVVTAMKNGYKVNIVRYRAPWEYSA